MTRRKRTKRQTTIYKIWRRKQKSTIKAFNTSLWLYYKKINTKI